MTDEVPQRGHFVDMRPFERGAVLLVLVLSIAGVGAVNLSHGRTDLALVWLAFTAYVMALGLPFILYQRRWGWLHPLIFTVLWAQLLQHMLPRLSVYASGLDAHRAMPNASPTELNAVVTEALLLTATALLAFYAAFFASHKVAAPRLSFRPPRLLFIKVVGVAAISMYALLVLADKAGGLGQLMLYRGMPPDARDALRAEMGGRHWFFLAGLLKLACLVWLALRPAEWRKPFFLALFALGLAIDFAATGSRSGAIVPILMAGAIWVLQYRRVPYMAIAVAAVLGVLVIGIGGEFRAATRSAQTLKDVELDAGFIESLNNGIATMTFRGAEINGTYAILAKVPSEVEFLYGQSYLSILFAPIPDIMLPFDKPQAGGKLNAIHVFGRPNTAIPPGKIGEAYWNFHIPGVLAVMSVFGVVLQWFGRLYVINDGAGWVTMCYVVTLFGLQPTSPAVYSWLHMLVPAILLLLLFCGVPKYVRHRAPECAVWI